MLPKLSWTYQMEPFGAFFESYILNATAMPKIFKTADKEEVVD